MKSKSEKAAPLKMIRWSPEDYDKVALAYARSMSESPDLSYTEHDAIAQKVLSKDKHKTPAAMQVIRVELRNHGIELFRKEQIAAKKDIATTPIISAARQPAAKPAGKKETLPTALPIKPKAIVPPGLEEVMGVGRETVISTMEEAIAKYVGNVLPNMLGNIMKEIGDDLRMDIRTQVVNLMSTEATKVGKGLQITFFPREFDAHDHGELPAATLDRRPAPKPRRINIAIVGPMDKQGTVFKNRFAKENVYLRIVHKDNPKQAVRSSQNMDYIIVAKDFISHSLVRTFETKPHIKDKIRIIGGQIDSISEEISKIIREVAESEAKNQ